MTTLYSCQSEETGFRLSKFDPDFNLLSSWHVTAEGNCDCPQGHKPTCRHRKMLPAFAKLGHIDDGWFYDWDTRQWRTPVGGANNPQTLEYMEEVSTIDHKVFDESEKVEDASPSPPLEAGSDLVPAQEAPVQVEVEAGVSVATPPVPSASASPSTGASTFKPKRRPVI